jgi:L-lysine 6-transaminase
MPVTQNTWTPRFDVPADDVLSTLRKHMLVDGFDHVVDLQRSHGAWFVEGRSGKEFLDFFTCIASMPIGMNHPKMMDAAFIEYLGRVALNKPSNSDIYNTEYATFVRTFFSLAVPDHFRYAFFIDGGTLAVENALKVAMDWKVRKNFAKGHRSEKGHQILHFERAFHGRSGYCLSLTNTDPSKTALFPRFDWPRVITPALTYPLTPESLATTIAQEELCVHQIKQYLIDRPDEIAAIIIEPIQGEGGDNFFRKEFLRTLRNLCDEHDMLLIFDEVQTGVGITGHMWAHQAYGIQPDIMSFGKKMQVCGILVGSRIDDVPDNAFHTSSRINSTWGGSLVDMARVTRYLEIIDEDGLVANAATVGAYLQQQLHGLAQRDERVGAVRGLGLWCAFDLPTADARNAFLRDTYNEGLLLVGSGTRSVRFRPPLTLTTDLVDQGMDIMSRVLSR